LQRLTLELLEARELSPEVAHVRLRNPYPDM
jgi:hypothetical protein